MNIRSLLISVLILTGIASAAPVLAQNLGTVIRKAAPALSSEYGINNVLIRGEKTIAKTKLDIYKATDYFYEASRGAAAASEEIDNLEQQFVARVGGLLNSDDWGVQQDLLKRIHQQHAEIESITFESLDFSGYAVSLDEAADPRTRCKAYDDLTKGWDQIRFELETRAPNTEDSLEEMLAAVKLQQQTAQALAGGLWEVLQTLEDYGLVFHPFVEPSALIMTSYALSLCCPGGAIADALNESEYLIGTKLKEAKALRDELREEEGKWDKAIGLMESTYQPEQLDPSWCQYLANLPSETEQAPSAVDWDALSRSMDEIDQTKQQLLDSNRQKAAARQKTLQRQQNTLLLEQAPPQLPTLSPRRQCPPGYQYNSSTNWCSSPRGGVIRLRPGGW